MAPSSTEQSLYGTQGGSLLLAALVASSANLGLVGERCELDVACQRLAQTDDAMAEAIGQAIVAAYPQVPFLPVGGG